jgi:separase
LNPIGTFSRATARTETRFCFSLGRPSLTAVLWDVTDAEIDKIAQSTSSQLRMDESHMEEIRAGKTDLPDSAISNAQALSKARECCKLKYLTGAAPVAYGIPIYFR